MIGKVVVCVDDQTIIDLYWKRSQRAITKNSRKYDAYCRTVAAGILADRRDAELMSASYYSEELYQSKIYGGLTEQEQQRKSQSLAESHIQLRLETTSGVVFWMGYQPKTGFVDWSLGHYLVG